MKKILVILALFFSLLSFSSCNNENSSNVSETRIISFSIGDFDMSKEIVLETNLIYDFELLSNEKDMNIRFQYEEEYFDLDKELICSYRGSTSLGVKNKVGETSIKVYVNDILEQEYCFEIVDNSIGYDLIDTKKINNSMGVDSPYEEYIDSIVALTSFKQYKEFIKKINYEEKSVYTEKWFEDHNIYFAFYVVSGNAKSLGVTKVYCDNDTTYFNLKKERTIEDGSFDFYFQVLSIKKNEVKEINRFCTSWF